LSAITVIVLSLTYLSILFGVAFWCERNVKIADFVRNNAYIYALSLAAYCTAWTYYGSVGRAATTGIGFLPIYLGPTLMAPLWYIILKKIILICKERPWRNAHLIRSCFLYCFHFNIVYYSIWHTPCRNY